MELFNRVFGLRGPNQIRAFVDRYDALARDAQLPTEAEGGASARREPARRDFEWTIRKSVHIHSDIKQAILLYGNKRI